MRLYDIGILARILGTWEHDGMKGWALNLQNRKSRHAHNPAFITTKKLAPFAKF